KRFWRGFSLNGSYVFSKALDDVINPAPGLTAGVGNPFNLNLEKGRGNFDHRHVLSFSWLWSPDYKFSGLLVKHLLGGWSMCAFQTVQTGAPLTIVMGTDVALNGTGQQNLQHAQLVPNVTNDDIPVNHP